jgi:hypothetical protein
MGAWLCGFSGLLCCRIVNRAGTLLFADREGRIRLWNVGPRPCSATAAEVVGHDLAVIIPEKLGIAITRPIAGS